MVYHQFENMNTLIVLYENMNTYIHLICRDREIIGVATSDALYAFVSEDDSRCGVCCTCWLFTWVKLSVYSLNF